VRAAHSMINDLAAGLEQMMGPTQSRLRLLSRAASIYDEIDAQGFMTPDLQRQTADGNRVLAKTYRTLGDAANAMRRSTAAVQQARVLVSGPEGNLDDRALLASSLVELGDSLQAQGEAARATEAYAESSALSEQIVRDPAATPSMRMNLSIVLVRQGDRLYYEGKLDQAETAYRQSLQLDRETFDLNPNDPRRASLYATDIERLGDVLYAGGQVEQSCAAYREALGVRRRAAELAPDEPAPLQKLALAMQNVGWCFEQESRVDEALARYDESIAIQKRLLSSDPSNVVAATNLIGGLATRASTLMSRGETDDALAAYREAYQIGGSLRESAKAQSSVGAHTAAIAQLFARALIKQNNFQEASAVLDSSVKTLEELMAQDPPNLDYPRKLAVSLLTQGDLHCARHRFAEGIERYQQALEVLEQVVAISGTSEDRQLQAYGHYKLGRGWAQATQPERARQSFLEGKQVLTDLRAAGHLSNASEGFRLYLPQIQQALGEQP
ncbi:MAG: hypothetical protein ACRD9R_06390, partial [Pyrinomonadaceae bacterium]